MDDGCRKLALELRRRGFTLDECLEGLQPTYPDLSRSTLHRFLKSQGVGSVRVKPERLKKKFKEYPPGFLHIDTFIMPPLRGIKRYCFLAVDRATRMFFLKVYDHKEQKNSKDFLEAALEFFPFKIHNVLTDNGSEYTNHYYKGGQACKTHLFDAVCSDNGIKHRLTKVRTPQTNGMAERMVQMTKAKALRPVHFDSHAQMEQAVLAWMWHYNCFRKHGSLKRKTPLSVASKWYKDKPEFFTRDPDTLMQVFTT